MNLVDLILIIILIITLVISYFRGFLKELYGLIILLVSLLIAFVLQDIVYDVLISKININNIINLDIPQSIIDLIISIIGPSISFALIFSVSLSVLPIIKFVLIITNLIPAKINKLRFLGIFIAFMKTIFVYTFIAFLISFTTFIPDVNIYNKSIFLKPLLNINIPLKRSSDDIHKIYNKVSNLMDKMKNVENNQDQLNPKEVVSIFKDLRKSGILTDDVVVASSKILFDQIITDKKTELDTSNLDFKEFKVAISESEIYSTIKELYDENILTAELIERIALENNIKGINKENVDELFK